MRNIQLSTLLLLAGLSLAARPLQAQEQTVRQPLSAQLQRAAAPISDRALLIPVDTSAIAPFEKPLTINEMRQQRGLTDVSNLFIPKGQWIFGGTASYSTHTNDKYQFLVIEGIDSKGYTFRVSPMVAYAFRNNMAIGLRFIYGRSLLKLDKADLNLGDTETGTHIKANDYYRLKHSYTGAIIWRQYIPLGRNKRFALFNEMHLSAGGFQTINVNDQPVQGTYSSGYELSLGISPGIIAFATNNMAVELNVGVMGINYTHTKQVHNQVEEGKYSSSLMNFKVNIFSIGLGLAFYL